MIFSLIKHIFLCNSKLYFEKLRGGAYMLLPFLFSTLNLVNAFSQDLCSTVSCSNLAVEVIRQEDNLTVGCPASGASCSDQFRQLTYKVYLRATKSVPTGPGEPFDLDYRNLDVAIKLKNNQTPQRSFIDVEGTQDCFENGVGVNWNNFPDMNGDKVIFEPTENRVAISFGNLTGSSACGISNPDGSTNRIRFSFENPPQWAGSCGAFPNKCAYAELFTVVVNVYPGEIIGFEFDAQSLMYVSSNGLLVCNPINQIASGTRSGLVNLVTTTPTNFTGTANETMRVRFGNQISMTNQFEVPIELQNTSTHAMTVSYVEFCVIASLTNASMEFNGVTPKVYPWLGGTQLLHYRIPVNLVIPGGQKETLCSIIYSPTGLENEYYAGMFDFYETSTKGRIKTSEACTTLNFFPATGGSSNSGDTACAQNQSVEFFVNAEEAACNQIKVKVGLTSKPNTTVQISSFSFKLQFEWADPAITIAGVQYTNWPGNNCQFGCFGAPLPICHSINQLGKSIEFCFSTDDQNALFFQLDPEKYVEVLINLPNGGCIDEVSLRKLYVIYAGTDYTKCIPARSAPSGFPICTQAINGKILSETNEGVEEVDVVLSANMTNCGGSCNTPCNNVTAPSSETGDYTVCSFCCDYATITPEYDINPLNGITTYDLVLISKHILGIEALGSPYKMIAADANISNSITTFDIVEFRKLILGIYTELPANTSWRFIDKTFQFYNPQNPFGSGDPDPFYNHESITCAEPSTTSYDFVAIKVGDVNNTAVYNSARPVSRPATYLSWPELRADAGETIMIPVVYQGDQEMEAIQLGFRFDPSHLQLMSVSKGDIESYEQNWFNLLRADSGEIRTLWLSMNGFSKKIHPGDVLFYLNFKVLNGIRAKLPLSLDHELLDGATWAPDGSEYAIQKTDAAIVLPRSAQPEDPALTAVLQPNPSTGSVVLEVFSETAGKSRLILYDNAGKRLSLREIQLIKGHQVVEFPEASALPAGVYVWKLLSPGHTVQNHLIRQ